MTRRTAAVLAVLMMGLSTPIQPVLAQTASVQSDAQTAAAEKRPAGQEKPAAAQGDHSVPGGEPAASDSSESSESEEETSPDAESSSSKSAGASGEFPNVKSAETESPSPAAAPPQKSEERPKEAPGAESKGAAAPAASASSAAKAADEAFSSSKSNEGKRDAVPQAQVQAGGTAGDVRKAPSIPPSGRKLSPLGQEIAKIIEGTPLAEARLGIEVLSLETGKVIYAQNANELLNPASNAKLFTSAAALSLLGPGFRFETEFLFDGDPRRPAPTPKPGEKKAPKQNLYVRGGGDPSITSETLWRIASDLYGRGLRKITGDIILDENYFDQEMVGAGFDQETSDRAYMAPPGALSLNWNSIGVHIAPAFKTGQKAFVAADPESDFITLENKTYTRGRRAVRRLNVTSAPSEDKKKQVVTVTGRIPVGSADAYIWRKVDDPGLYFGHTLKRFLQMRGIQVKGEVRKGPVPTGGVTTLVLHRSQTLDAVLKFVNKNSSNMVAEHLVKTMGARIFGPPGSWRSGLYAIERFLDVEAGLKPGTYILKNGSGLNDVNRFSAHQVNQILLAMWRRFPLSPEYMSSLGIAAEDGTLQFRMTGTPAAGRLRAKTGTLENVSALSGYVQTVGGERWAFSIIANDFPGRAGKVVPLLDAIAAAIADQGDPHSKKAAAASISPSLTPLNRLAQFMTSANAVALERDAGNLPRLFALLPGERDPAKRALIADAILQTAPDNGDAARTFLRHFDLSEDCFGRLVKMARNESVPTPLIQSLAGLAADGNQEALSLLLGLTVREGSDKILQKELTDALVEVAFEAPEAVFRTLLKSDADKAARAIPLLAQGIRDAEANARKPEPEDPTDAAASQGTQSPKKPPRTSPAMPEEPPPPHPFPECVQKHLKGQASKRIPSDMAEALRAAFPAQP